jgi:multidrug efflux pump subunit AcrB
VSLSVISSLLTKTEEDKMKAGLSGSLANYFKQNQLTPLLALVALLLGLFAVLVTPREEEPQIDVTMANVFIPFAGASAKQVEQQVAIAAEKIVAELEGVEHIWSVSEPGMAVLTVQFEVGQDRTAAVVRLYNAFYAKQDWQPANSGIGPVLIKPKGIEDVPVFALTLWSTKAEIGRADLARLARSLESELQQVPGSRDIYALGVQQPVVLIELDPARLAAYQLTAAEIQQQLQAANQSSLQQALLQPAEQIQLQAGQWLQSAEQAAQLVVAVVNDQPVYLGDVADVALKTDQATTYVQHLQNSPQGLLQSDAVTLVVAKKPGQNAVAVTQALEQKLQQLKQDFIPAGVEYSVSRNYGETAKDKADTLIHKLMFATACVVLLVAFALGSREAAVVGVAVIITLALTLFASWAWGFTLNRVSLFALIFSIGILVDDAIVVVENLHRHWLLQQKPLVEAIGEAVEEVGGPTILATFTVVAALLPMAFVSGLMGPYMSPIPINASIGMLISLLVAFIVTPWLFLKVFANRVPATTGQHQQQDQQLELFFSRMMTPFLRTVAGRKARLYLLLGLLALIVSSVLLVVAQKVVLKMLPFDNKSEFQLVVDLPEGKTLEQTQQVLNALSVELLKVAEVTHIQTYAGTSAPINFNGLVRQYYLRTQPWQGDVQVNLLPRQQRDRQSHDIALSIRPVVAELAKRYGAVVKVVEVPPGPPVLSPLVAEIYAPAEQLSQQTRTLIPVFEQEPSLVDLDSSVEAAQKKWQLVFDQAKGALLGVSQQQVTDLVSMAVTGRDVSYLHTETQRSPLPLRLQVSATAKAQLDQLLTLQVRTSAGALVPLSELVDKVETVREQSIYRKDLRRVLYITADAVGELDSPLYSMLQLSDALAEQHPKLQQHWIAAPETTTTASLKWDGEWQITYETFRDMGIAYGVGLLLIYLLVVAQFHSYKVPLIIMAPIPLTMIGIMPGHWLLDKQFTATSMIGMIALAGIIVRNSILLVDLIQQQTKAGVPLDKAVIHAAAVRTRPIVLTALAAMLGALFILDDPIFSGLAVALVFGIFVSTLLTLLVIPVVYYAYHYQKS